MAIELHGGCGYQGYEFGANYPDSVCLDGWLFDADSGYAIKRDETAISHEPILSL